MATLPRWATYRINADGSVTIRFSYCPAVIDAFKRRIPKAFRAYAEHEGKAWIVRYPYVDEAISSLLAHFPDAQRETADQSQRGWEAGAQTLHDPFAVLHLRPSAPREVVEASFRALAKIHHPDKGGDPAMMRRIAEAHESLAKRLSA